MTDKAVAIYIGTESGDEHLFMFKFNEPLEALGQLIKALPEHPFYWATILVRGDQSKMVEELIRAHIFDEGQPIDN